MYEKIRSVLVKYSNGVPVTRDTKLTDDLGLDSIDRAEIGVELEDMFGLPEGIILHEDMMTATNVRDLVAFMEQCVKHKDLKLTGVDKKTVTPKLNLCRVTPFGSRICTQTNAPCNKITHLKAVDDNLDFCNIVKCKIAENYIKQKVK